MKHKRVNEVDASARLFAQSGIPIGVKGLSTHYKVEAFRPGKDGKLVPLWTEEFDNLVVNVGLDDSLDKHLKGSAYTAAWYVGLVSATPTFAPADTMDGAHAGWSEQTEYDEATREALVLGAVSGQSVDNSASKPPSQLAPQ